MKGKKIALWVSSKAFNCSIVLIELRKEKIRVDCIVLNCWITRDKHKEHHQQQQRLMEMASCNNCSLKEKEQVYTAARDGNLMYLKVSFAGWPSWRSRHCTNHKPASIRWISIEPWIHFSSRFCRFVYFDSIFFLPSNDLTFFSETLPSIWGSPVGVAFGVQPCESIHTHHPHTLARPSTNDKKKGFFFSSLLLHRLKSELWVVCEIECFSIISVQGYHLLPASNFFVWIFFARVSEGFSQICLFFFALPTRARGWFMKIDNDLSGVLLTLLSLTCHDVV